MAEARVERRLAAILAADVAGYSRLMSADEAGTLAALHGHRCELITPAVERHQGRIVKLMGERPRLLFHYWCWASGARDTPPYLTADAHVR